MPRHCNRARPAVSPPSRGGAETRVRPVPDLLVLAGRSVGGELAGWSGAGTSRGHDRGRRSAGHQPGVPRAAVLDRVAEIASIVPDVDDGVRYAVDTARARTIREGALYTGVRSSMDAHVSTATVKLKLDINFRRPDHPCTRRATDQQVRGSNPFGRAPRVLVLQLLWLGPACWAVRSSCVNPHATVGMASARAWFERGSAEAPDHRRPDVAILSPRRSPGLRRATRDERSPCPRTSRR